MSRNEPPIENTGDMDTAPSHDREWDAGELGCGDFVLELQNRVTMLGPGQVIKIRAADPGAPADIPAWCNLTDNPLLLSLHPLYWIRRKS